MHVPTSIPRLSVVVAALAAVLMGAPPSVGVRLVNDPCVGMTACAALTVSASPSGGDNGTGEVTSSPAGIDCRWTNGAIDPNSTCTSTFRSAVLSELVITFTGTPATGSDVSCNGPEGPFSTAPCTQKDDFSGLPHSMPAIAFNFYALSTNTVTVTTTTNATTTTTATTTAPSSTSATSTTTTTVPTPASTSGTKLAARIVYAAVLGHGAKRTLHVKIRVSELATAQVRLVRSGRQLLLKSYAVKPVANLLIASIPAKATPGTDHLTITLTDAAGHTKMYFATVLMPA
jgi:hypothetical protein